MVDTDDPPETVVRRVADTAHRWVRDRVGAFDPTRTDPLEAVPARQKALAELAHATRVRRRHAAVDDRIVDRVVRSANDPAVWGRLDRAPRRVTDVGVPLAVAHARDALDEAPLSSLTRALESDAAWHVERDPFAQLELAWLAAIVPTVDGRTSPQTLATRSSLAQPPDPILATDMEAYKFTHAVFFATDYGRLGPGFAVPATDGDLAVTVAGLLVRSLARDQWDLVVELVAAGSLVGALPTELYALAVDRLGEVCAETHLPGPDPSDGDGSVSHGDFSDADPTHREWAENYHTNLAAAMLLPASLDARSSTGGVSPPDEPVRETAATLGAAVDALARYRLGAAAECLGTLADTPLPDSLAAVRDRCVAYLARQRRSDGDFGFWWDERVHAAHRDDTDVDFDAVVDRTSRQCADTLETLRDDPS